MTLLQTRSRKRGKNPSQPLALPPEHQAGKHRWEKTLRNHKGNHVSCFHKQNALLKSVCALFKCVRTHGHWKPTKINRNCGFEFWSKNINVRDLVVSELFSKNLLGPMECESQNKTKNIEIIKATGRFSKPNEVHECEISAVGENK